MRDDFFGDCGVVLSLDVGEDTTLCLHSFLTKLWYTYIRAAEATAPAKKEILGDVIEIVIY